MAKLTLFDRITTETARIASIPSSQIPLSKGRLKRWQDLAAYWKTRPDLFPDIFYETLFHIARGQYSCTATAKTLLVLVEEAILADIDALSTWRTNQAFRVAFDAVIKGLRAVPYSKRRWKSFSMLNYVCCRMYCLIIYKGVPMPTLNRKNIRGYQDYHRIMNRLEIHGDYIRFVEIMELLVPSCKYWTDAQWVSEAFILKQIHAIHGIDYSKHIAEFDKLINMLTNKLEGIPYYRNLFDIKVLPVSIAAVIWPCNMEKEICAQFNTACRIRPRKGLTMNVHPDPIDPMNMRNSWAFTQMEMWRKQKTYT